MTVKTKYILLLCAICSGFVFYPPVRFIVPKNWPKPAYDFSKNKLSNEKIDLGRRLFYDPILSKDNTVSCASCHSPYNAFAHVDHALSHGIGDSIGFRNAPSLMNLAWQKSFMWDGAISNLDEQAIFPITHPKEMGEDIYKVIEKLNSFEKYPIYFNDAYGDSLITKDRVLKSISQFLLTLVSSDSKYDSVMRNQSEFTTQEKNGYKVFRQNCSVCHKEPLFTNGEFANNGLSVNSKLNDIGRMKITGKRSDSLLFKVPTLRNIQFTYPYMHDGRFLKLSEVISHYQNGIHLSATLSEKLKNKFSITADDKVDLISFLLTLTDRHFVFNPAYQYLK